MEDWGNFLHRILKEDSKDSAPIKMFLLVWGFWWQATAARGGHWWSWVVEKEVLGFGWRFGEEERVEIVFFTLNNKFIIYRSRLESSSR